MATKKSYAITPILPPYSPNLNPIERLWIMNEQVRNNRFLKGAKDFKEAISRFLMTFCQVLGIAWMVELMTISSY